MFHKEKFREERRKRKISQEQLGRMLGKDRKTIGNWEKGAYAPYESDIRVAAQYLNVSVSDISDLEEIDCSTLGTRYPLAPKPLTSFVDKIESTLSIQDRIFLDGINAELQTLRDKMRNIEQQTSLPEVIADEISSLIYKKDLEGKFTYANKAFKKHLNVDDNEILYRNNREVFKPQEAEILDKIEEEVIRGSAIHNRKIDIPGSMNKKHGLLSVTSLYKPNGLLKEIIVKIENVTSELEIIDRYKTLENVIHSSNEILWIKANDSTYTFVGAPVYPMTGHRANDLVKNSRFWLTDIVDEHDRDRVAEFYTTHESGDSIDYKIKTKDDKIKFVKEKVFRQNDLTFGTIHDVTHELKAEEDKQLLLEIIDKMPEPIAVVKNFGKDFATFSSCMPKMLHTSKGTVEEMCEEGLSKVVYKSDRKKLTEYIKRLDSEEWWNSETKNSMHDEMKYRIGLKNGKVKWIRVATYSTPSLKKRGIRFSIFRDITKEQKQIEEMQHLFECVNDMDSMFWVAKRVDKDNKNKTDYKYVTVSDGVKKIYGLDSKKEFSKDTKTLKDFLHAADRKLTDNQVKAIKFPHTIEYKIDVDGKTKYLQKRIYKKHNLLFGITSDVTKRKKTEGTASLLKYIMNDLKDLVWITTNVSDYSEFKMLYINNGCEAIFNEPKEVFYKKPTHLSELVHPDDKKKVFDWWAKTTSLKGKTSLTYRIIRKDGIVKKITDTQYSAPDWDGQRVKIGILKEA